MHAIHAVHATRVQAPKCAAVPLVTLTRFGSTNHLRQFFDRPTALTAHLPPPAELRPVSHLRCETESDVVDTSRPETHERILNFSKRSMPTSRNRDTHHQCDATHTRFLFADFQASLPIGSVPSQPCALCIVAVPLTWQIHSGRSKLPNRSELLHPSSAARPASTP